MSAKPLINKDNVEQAGALLALLGVYISYMINKNKDPIELAVNATFLAVICTLFKGFHEAYKGLPDDNDNIMSRTRRRHIK